MNKLAGIDTTRVYHDFNFSSDQLTNLKCEQWFIHIDLVDAIETFLNNLANWNAIKILYRQIHHFDLDHVKCLEIYYKKNNRHHNLIPIACATAQYNMWWKPGTVYYSRKFHSQIDENLEKQNLKKYLIKTYEMKANHLIEVSFKVYEFKQDLSGDQKLTLNNIFEIKESSDSSIFISRNYLFLNVTTPPTIMKTEIFVGYHGKFLANLNIEDILALELANKDHRLPFYDRALDHDIQMHLKTRLPMFYKKKKLQTYFAKEFTNAKILKYFIYKYQHCLYKITIPHRMMNRIDYDLIKDENKTIKFDIVEDNNFHVDIISPENIVVGSMIYRTSKEVIDLSGSAIPLTVRQIHMDGNLNLKWKNFNTKSHSDVYKSSYIEIIIQTDYWQPNLSALILKLLKITEKFSKFENGTIRLTCLTLPNDIDISIIRNIFLNRLFSYKLELKYNTFRLRSLMRLLNTTKAINSITFINCEILMESNYFRIHTTSKSLQKNVCKTPNFVLEFKNMFIDLNLPIDSYNIVYDNCRVIQPIWLVSPWDFPNTVYFKNMRIELHTILSMGYLTLVFEKCQIETPLLLSSGSDLTVETVNQTANHPKKKKEKCAISSKVRLSITFKNMDIHIKALQKFAYKFKNLTFENCRILYPDNFKQDGTIELNYLHFTDMLFTSELLSTLKYFDAPIEFRDCQITNENLLQIWTIRNNQKLFITGKHQINGYIYMELIATQYENRLDHIHRRFRIGKCNPFKKSIKIEWLGTLYGHINWSEIKIKSFWIDDMNIKLEYLQNDIIIDLFDELKELPIKSDFYYGNPYSMLSEI